MNFFEYQEQAQRRTVLLVFLYGLSVISIAVVLYLVLFFTLSKLDDRMAAEGRPGLFLWTFVGVMVIVGLGTLYKVLQLSQGGSVVAKMLGGRAVTPATEDPLERRLVNVVEEMALASGTPMPKVYVLDQEPGINAFAAGLGKRDAVVAVTRGALELLNRDELQGVIAHEFSHIHNGDMRLNLRLMGVLHGILLLSLIGYYTMRVTSIMGRGRGSGRRGGREGGAVVLAIFLLGLVLWILGMIGVFFANLIKSAVSRQREYLADASAVQFTRNPAGLANALKKIGALGKAGAMRADRAQEASHLFFAGGLRGGLFNLLSTHPPLINRIRRLDPTFTGIFDPSAPQLANALGEEGGGDGGGRKGQGGGAGVASLSGTAAKVQRAKKVSVRDFSQKSGEFSAAALQKISTFLQGLPKPLREALQRPGEAPAVIWALLCAAAEERGEKGYGERIGAEEGVLVKERVAGLVPFVMQTPRGAWMIVAAAAVPALREMAPEVYARFRQGVQAVMVSDERVTLFEYTMLRFLIRRLDGYFGLAVHREAANADLASFRQECAVLLGTIARLGAEGDEANAAVSFAAGWRGLGLGDEELPSAERCILEEADQALERLALLRPAAKQMLLKACELCVAKDGTVTVDEADFLYAVADALGCSVPPIALMTGSEEQEDQAAALRG